jgi:ABC-type nitrate/sulfonate/bicarbonate transport system substrate-binding protein
LQVAALQTTAGYSADHAFDAAIAGRISEEPMPVSMTVGTFTPSVLLRVARRTGQLADAGLAVTESPVPSSPAQFEALLDGRLHAVLTSPDNVLAYRYSPTNPLGRTADARIVSAVDRGMGLGLYARAGVADPAALRGARFGVDVPASGFAFAMYALAESLGLAREDYEVVALGSTPKRLRALLAGDCDATMLNAGNELHAEAAGLRPLARAGETLAPYLGTVLAVVGDAHQAAADRLAVVLIRTACTVADGRLDREVVAEASAALDLPETLADRYLARLKDPAEGLVTDGVPDLAAIRTLVDLRRRFRPETADGADVFAPALEPGTGLLVTGGVPGWSTA